MRIKALAAALSLIGVGFSRADVLTGTWEEIVPLRPGVFSIALGSQIQHAPSKTGQPQDSDFLLGRLAELGSPILRLPGGDSLNSWSYETGSMHAADFWKLAAAGHSVPLWGVNVTTSVPTATEALGRELIRIGAPTTYFELGNELYLQRWAEMTRTAAVYAEKAAPHAAVLRRMFPHAKLGVPLASYWGLKDPDQLGPWITEMAKRTDFFDAVVLHLYLVPTDLGPTGLATHTPAEVRDWAWSRCDVQEVKRVYGMVHRVFPTKDIWVTEWAFNASQYLNRNGKDVRFQVHQTMLAMLYNARFMLNTAYYVPYVPVMTIWTLYEQAAVAILKGDRTTIVYELYRLIREAREGSDGLAHLAWSEPSMDAFGFYSGRQLRSVVVLNSSSAAREIKVPDLVARGAGKARALWSREMLPEWGNPRNPSPSDWSPPYRVDDVAVRDGAIRIPPNSITVIPAQ